MKKLFVLVVVSLVIPVAAEGHLCNDVFVQAKDNLVVKVDVRDGQLRISKTGTFKVYLLNTMDRDIAKIYLEVQSSDFDAEVKQSSDWRGYPVLKTTKRGGKKECFEVELTRKRGTKEGKYKIGLLLHGGNRNKAPELCIRPAVICPAYKLPGSFEIHWNECCLWFGNVIRMIFDQQGNCRCDKTPFDGFISRKTKNRFLLHGGDWLMTSCSSWS